MYSRNLWAPELYYLEGNWYIYFTADDGNQPNHRMYVLKGKTQDPLDGFDFVCKLETIDDFAIDGVPFYYNDKLYFVCSGGFSNATRWGNGIYIAPMKSPTEMEMPGYGVLISYPENGWELVGGTTNEAPAVIVKNGEVSVFFSASTASNTAYCLGRVTCTNGDLLNADSWEKTGPVLSQSIDKRLYGPGSCCFVESPDGKDTWIVYHAKLYTEDGWDRRVWTQKIEFDGNTPIIPAPPTQGQMIPVPSGTVLK